MLIVEWVAVGIYLIVFIFWVCSLEVYEYKPDPEVIATSEFGVQIIQSDGERIVEKRSLGVEIKILQENNLQTAYLIQPDYEVEKLEIIEEEAILLSKINEKSQLGMPDFSIGDIDYQYTFLLLKGLDGTYELYLIYTKSEGEEFTFAGVSEAEVWGLANAHEGEVNYEGERRMAEQYLRILEGCRNYIM